MAKFKSLRAYAERYDLHGNENYRILEELLRREIFCNVTCLMSDVLKLLSNVGSAVARELSFDDDEARKLGYVPGDRVDACESEDVVFVSTADDEWYSYKGPGTPFTKTGLTLRRSKGLRWYENAEGEAGGARPTAADALDAYWMARLDGPYDTKKAAAEAYANEHDIRVSDDEVYEHYAVSSAFGRRLEEVGEQVLDIGNLNIWCRTTTGQAASMDHCIHQIAFNMGILQGQELDWSKNE